jgi:Putative adhesin
MQTFDTPEPISLDVEIGVGDIRIDARDRTDTTVEVRPSDPAKKGDVAAAEQTRVEYANGHLLVKAASNWRQWLPRRGGGSIDVQIESPTGSRVRTEAGVATLHGRGRLGECRCKVGVGGIQLDETGPVDVKTGAGDVTVERVVGKAGIVTGSGATRIGVVEGSASVKGANGDTWIGEVTGEARVSSANGTIAVDRAHEGVVAKTANGSVRLGEVARGAAVAQTAMGDVEVGIRDGVAAWLDLDTKFGNVRNELDDSQNPRADDETVEVRASTSFGDIVIHRSLAARAGSDAS